MCRMVNKLLSLIHFFQRRSDATLQSRERFGHHQRDTSILRTGTVRQVGGMIMLAVL